MNTQNIKEKIIHCPNCKFQHIDPLPYSEKNHNKHLCLNKECGKYFVDTEEAVGVKSLNTKEKILRTFNKTFLYDMGKPMKDSLKLNHNNVRDFLEKALTQTQHQEREKTTGMLDGMINDFNDGIKDNERILLKFQETDAPIHVQKSVIKVANEISATYRNIIQAIETIKKEISK